MNLHGIVTPLINAVNPATSVTIKSSTGYTTAADGSQVPTYSTQTVQAQIQALSAEDLQQIDGLNIEGVVQKAYLPGDYEGVFRVLGKGGDLLLFGGRTYLVVKVFERWPDWCSLAITVQTDS